MKKLVTFVAALALMLCAGIFLVACGGGGAKSITNLTYNGETITWTSVRNAKNYRISIDGGTEEIVSQAEGTVSYRYDAEGADFDFSIEAVIKEGSDKNPTYSIRFENIGQVEGLAIEQGNLVWTVLEEAEKYEVMYNGDIVSSDVGTNSFPAKAGQFTYRVRALKGQAESTDGNIPYYSVWSQPLSGTVLSAPQNLTYDSETFSWEKVSGATGYIVRIGNEEYTTANNTYAYAAPDHDFEVSVSAVGDAAQDLYDSAASDKKQYRYIAPIEGLNVEDGILKWSPSENAVRYRIKIGGIVQDEELTRNEYAALASGTSYRIQILPLGTGDFWFSRWSNEMTINILRSPVVSFGDSMIRWNQVTGSAGYELKIEKDSEVIHTTAVGAETFVYNYAFADAGEYYVYVKATSLGEGGIYESKYSQPYSVRRLATPSNEQVINRPLEQNQVSVTFTPAVGASGHELHADGVMIAQTTEGNTFSVDLSRMTNRTEESVVNFEIYAIGGVTTEGAVLDSAIPLEFNVTKLATPQNFAINGNRLEWESVNNTSKYVLTIDGRRIEVTTTSHILTDLSSGNHTFYVQAMGNGENVITGGFSNALDVNKLAKPASLNIQNGNLTWGAVQGATAYRVLLGNRSYDADTTAFSLLGYLNDIAEGMGTQISVFAIGNGSNVIDSDVSDTRTISKYARPSAIRVSGDRLVWNASSVNSINCNEYTLTIGGSMEKTVRVTGTSYALTNFGSGDYTVSVVANGDNEITLDSPSSDSYAFTKLAAITSVRKADGQYQWDPVAGASAYEIKLSKDATWTTVNTTSYTPAFKSAGEFAVSIRAVGNGSDIVSSESYDFTQGVSALTTPVYQDSMSYANAFKVETDGNRLIVTVRKQSGAAGYKMYVGGIERQNVTGETETTITFEYTMTTVGAVYAVQVQVLGGFFNESGIYMLDSNLSTEKNVTYQG